MEQFNNTCCYQQWRQRFVYNGRSGSISFKLSKTWDQNKVTMIIKCKHAAQKELLDPHAHMVLTAQQWIKIMEEVQKIVQSKVLRNGKCVKTNGMDGIPIAKSFHIITREQIITLLFRNCLQRNATMIIYLGHSIQRPMKQLKHFKENT